MRKAAWFVLVSVLVICSGCAVQDPGAVLSHGPGFWVGLWHGFVAPWALIGHLFNKSIAVYQIGNSGYLYDLGFVLGLSWLNLLR